MKSLNASAENCQIPGGLSLDESHGFTQEYNINVLYGNNFCMEINSADTIYAKTVQHRGDAVSQQFNNNNIILLSSVQWWEQI